MSQHDRCFGSAAATTLLSSSITFHYDTKDYAFGRTLIPHMKAIDQHIAELGFEQSYDDDQYINFALAFDEAGCWKEAEKLYTEILQIRKSTSGEEHPFTLMGMSNLASIYWKQGRWKEVEELDVKVMEIRRRVLGEDHPDMLRSMDSLAATYWKLGRWKEAEKLDVEVMDMRKRLFGEEHPDILSSMENLGTAYNIQQ